MLYFDETDLDYLWLVIYLQTMGEAVILQEGIILAHHDARFEVDAKGQKTNSLANQSISTAISFRKAYNVGLSFLDPKFYFR